MTPTRTELTLARARTVLTSAVTYLVTLAAVVPLIAAELEAHGAPAVVLRWLAGVAGVLGVVVAIIRRVTPVLPAARGMLPADPGIPSTVAEADLLDELAAADPAALAAYVARQGPQRPAIRR